MTKQLTKIFFSPPMTLGLLGIYALVCAAATFIEKYSGISSANVLIYQSLWFDLLHLLLGIHLVGVMIRGRMLQNHFASFLLHLSILVILLGAGVTRYFGVEGGMHIREGESSRLVFTREERINLSIKDYQQSKSYSFPTALSPLYQSPFQEKISLDEETLKLKITSYTPTPTPQISVELSTSSQMRIVTLLLNDQEVDVELDGVSITLSWGAREIDLPFELHLEKFVMETYAGTGNPSSYASKVVIRDGDKEIPYTIFMNHTLDYGGYRFYQSSYDKDLQGTILSVNYDCGKWITYCGYALLIVGFLCVFFSRRSYVRKLYCYLRASQINALLLALVCVVPVWSEDNLVEFFTNFQARSKQASEKFGSLIVQDFDGRFEPMDTLALDLIHKISKSDKVVGIDANGIVLGMMIFPTEFRQLKMIKIKNSQLKQILSIPQDQTMIAYNDVFLDGFYVLENYAQEALRKDASKRDEFDKSVLKLDEQINIASYIYSGLVLRIIPSLQPDKEWLTPAQNLPFGRGKNRDIQVIIGDLFFGFDEGVREGEWETYNQAIQLLHTLQSQSPSLPSPQQIKLELWLNAHSPFKILVWVYLGLSCLLLGVGVCSLFASHSVLTKTQKVLYFGLILAGVFHLFSLGIRWYISDHAPWSNAYESMIYIAFSCALAGVLFCYRWSLALCASSAIAGISLFVANLSFMDPQITPLVPVLKSYWLNIHVSIITASYGFFGLCFMVGLLSLILFVFRGTKKLDMALCNLHCINELSMFVGLAMLTIGNFLGGVWANESWGRYWGWDPKETWSLISIVVYSILVHLRLIKKWYSPYSFAIGSIFGFFAILMTYFGVNYFLAGRHSYASGDYFEIPMYVCVLFGVIVSLIIGSWRKRKLKLPQL